jgi:hypothetical protein
VSSGVDRQDACILQILDEPVFRIFLGDELEQTPELLEFVEQGVLFQNFGLSNPLND